MWLWFVEKGWLYCMLIMGVVLTVQLIIHWKDWTFLRKMGAFTVIVLVFHVMEEWVMPGGFHYYYNISSDAILRDRYPMNELTDMITNFGGALIWFILVQTDKYERKMSFCRHAVWVCRSGNPCVGSFVLPDVAVGERRIFALLRAGDAYGVSMLAAVGCCLYCVFCKDTG